MDVNLQALPALVALAILVAVFAAISRQHTEERVRLWLIGWAFVLVRAFVMFIHPNVEHWDNLNRAIGMSALELASISFVVSVAPKATTWKRQLVLGSVLGVPSLVYTYGAIWSVESRWFYITAVLVALCAGLAVLTSWYRRVSVYVVSIGLASTAVAAVIG